MFKTLLSATALLLAAASVAQASSIRFDLEGEGAMAANSTETVDVSFTVDTSVTGTATSAPGLVDAHTFDPVSALLDFSIIRKDVSGSVLNTVGVDTSLSPILIRQFRSNAGSGAAETGSNNFRIDFTSTAALTGVSSGFLSVRLGSSGFGTTSGPATPINDVLFDDPENLLNTALSNNVDIDNLNIFSSTGIASTAIGNFRFTSLTLSDPTPAPPPSVVPLPASLPLLLSVMGWIAFLRRRAKS